MKYHLSEDELKRFVDCNPHHEGATLFLSEGPRMVIRHPLSIRRYGESGWAIRLSNGKAMLRLSKIRKIELFLPGKETVAW